MQLFEYNLLIIFNFFRKSTPKNISEVPMCRLYIITYYIRYPAICNRAAMVCAVFPWVQRHAAAASAGAGGLGNTPGVRNTLCLAIYLAFLLRQKKSKNMPRVTMVSKFHFKNCT